MAAGSDIDFKQLFAFPELACELLRCALPLPWARRIRPGDLERVNSSYINRSGQQRHDDIVWCIHRGARPNIYMLVEFQARPEQFMALRMLSYSGLLCEDLVHQHRATHGHLPVVLPLVLYCGRAPWTAATSLVQLRPQVDPYLDALQPGLKYHLVDRHNASPLIRALLEIEQADERQFQLVPELATIAVWARRQHNPDLSRTIADWIRRQLGVTFDMQKLPPECSLEEIYMMFEHKFRDFEHLLEFQATERGLQKGLKQGLEQGLEQGRDQGIAQGRAEAELAERRRILQLLVAHNGGPASGQFTDVIHQASSDQLALWIERMIAGELPPELKGH